MTENIVISELQSMRELSATVELQKAVWGMDDAEVASPHTLRAIVHSGGAVFGAAAQGRLVGFCFGFAAPRAGELWLWSHMTGVHPCFQRAGVGFMLKQAQRDWALRQGYRWMAWTFDPLQCGNANFNFNRLGITAGAYSVNHYGDMQDGINAGLASDRLEAHWRLDAPHVREMAAGAPRSAEQDLSDLRKLLYVDAAGATRHMRETAPDGGRYGIEIPLCIAELKRRDITRAKQWQLCLREAITDLLAAGYIVSGFARGSEAGCYILSQRQSRSMPLEPHPPAPSPAS